MKLEGLGVVVTGGASGLGLAGCCALADLGAEVWALDREAAHIEQARDSLSPARRERIHFHGCDVGIEADVIAAFDAAEEATGGVRCLVSCAAVLRDQALVSRLRGRVHRADLDRWNETLASNLTGTFLCGREAAYRMAGGKRAGVIVNVSSVSRRGNPGQSAYSATKGGVDALTATWARELAPLSIRVAAIAPGFIETRMTQGIPPIFFDQIVERTPLKRCGTLDEFAAALRFIIENDYVCGTTLELDGDLRL